MAFIAPKQPVSIDGVEFDALIEEEKTLTVQVPVYPVEKGYPVSDTAIPEPPTVHMILYVSNTPVTWMNQHSPSKTRAQKVCSKIQKKFRERKLLKITTSNTTYTNMMLTECSILKSQELGYNRQITITAQKVFQVSKKTTKVPKLASKSGGSKASGGKAQTSTTANQTSNQGSSSSSGGSSSSSGSNRSSGSGTQSQRSQSILYGITHK